MTKQEIINRIARRTGIGNNAVRAVVEEFMVQVRESLINGEPVYLRGFGTFSIKQRAAKVARNISKGTAILLPAHSIPAFKPVKSFQRAVKESQASDVTVP